MLEIQVFYPIFLKPRATHYTILLFSSHRKHPDFCIQRSELSSKFYAGCCCSVFICQGRVELEPYITSCTFFQNQLDSYRIASNPRGVCLIIDCVGNDGGETLCTYRRGEQIFCIKYTDGFLPPSDLLEQTFKALHFRVVIHKWLSARQILTTLQETVRQREHTEGDVFACCIISRGTSNNLLGTDSWITGLQVDIVRRQLAASGCPALADKPKLFFLQKYSVEEVQVYNGGNHRDEDLETDGFGSAAEAAVGDLIHEDADVFWSQCWTDERQLEKEQHSSVYVRALTDALLNGQRRYPRQHV